MRLIHTAAELRSLPPGSRIRAANPLFEYAKGEDGSWTTTNAYGRGTRFSSGLVLPVTLLSEPPAAEPHQGPGPTSSPTARRYGA